jgi:hypothetical protein
MPETSAFSDREIRPEEGTAVSLPEEDVRLFENAGTAVLAGLSKAQKEIAEFVAERIRQDIDSQVELMRCRTLDEVLDVQSRFVNTAMDQYAAEASRLARIGAEMIGAPRH